MQNGLDRLLATYCSPTLAGIKPASLVSCDRNLYPDLPQRLKEYRDAFSAREIHFEIVCARIAMSKDFPHEIGLFLGYPIEDVVGFIRYAGKGCKLSGLWKVYGDAEAASRLFDRLSRVCHAVTRRVDKGETLLEVFAA